MSEKFSIGVFKDVLRRIMPLSIVFLAITSLVSAVTVMFQTWAYEQLMLGGSAFVGNVVAAFDFYEMSPLAVTFATVLVPILVLVSNSYMTRRADADFYDSLPHTRLSMSVSSMLAVYMISAFILLVSFGVAVLCGYIFADNFTVPWGANLLKLLVLLITVWISVAVFSISTAITGTTFNALAVGFLIAGGPRALMGVINGAIVETSPVLLTEGLIPLFDNNYNFYTALSVSNLSVVTSPVAYVYSVALATLYTVFAMVAFCRRRSEAATHSAPSPILQHVYRISIATLVFSLSLYLVFGYGLDSTAVVVAVLSLIVYFLYELITTKRAKNLLGALAALPLFVLVNALIAGVIALGSYTEANYTPDADEVDSVSIVLYGEDTYVSLDQYATMMSENVALTDKESIDTVTSALRENVEKHNDGTYSAVYHSAHADYTNAVVKIKSGARTEYRAVYISTEKYTGIINKLAEAEDYRKLWYSLPQNPDAVSVDYGYIVLDAQESRAVYDKARAEIFELGYEAWCELYYSADYLDAQLTLNFNVNVDGNDVTVYINLPTELAEAYAEAEVAVGQFMSECYRDTLSRLDEFLSDDGEELSLMVDAVIDGDVYSAFGYRSDYNELGSAAEFVDFVSGMITDEYASYFGENYVQVIITDYGSDAKRVDITCKISGSVTIEQIKAIFEKYGYVYE